MRRTLTTVHILLACFFLPIALMFASTGGLYTLAVKGGYEERTLPVSVTEPHGTDLAQWLQTATGALDAAGEPRPSGSPSLKKAGTSMELEWTGVARDVVLRPTDDPLHMELLIKDTTAWRHLVQLHKAKGSEVAKAISVAWAIALVLLVVTGAWMALTVPNYRRLALPAGAAGLLTFAAYVLLG